MVASLRFKPISHSWVALHPDPKGVIQFIGGAFFGTFGPMIFYRHLLKYFYERSYSIVVLPFAFTFDHYRETGFLAQEQYRILPELVRMALVKGYPYEIYLNERNYTWMGHSLGCKYISLLEGLSELPKDAKKRAQFIRDLLTTDVQNDDSPGVKPKQRYSPKEINRVIQRLNAIIEQLKQEKALAEALIDTYIHRYTSLKSTEAELLYFTDIFFKNQISILLAPDISDTSSAIKPKALAHLIDRLGLGVKPTPAITHKLIRKSNIFNRLGLVSFKCDKIAAETCDWFTENLKKPPKEYRASLQGRHLRPLGIDIGNVVFNPLFDPLAISASKRDSLVESPIAKLLDAL